MLGHLTRVWNERWFRLQADGFLYYYRDQTVKDPMGGIRLQGASLAYVDGEG